MATETMTDRKNAAISRGVGMTTQIYAERAENAEIWDKDGKRYIDFAAGIAVVNTGHRHPKVIQAVKDQLDRFTHTCHQVVPYENYVALAERLNRLVPGDFEKKTIFATTGAEAVENAVKIARYATGLSAIVAFTGAFHGRTFMGMTLTGKVQPYKAGFGPMMNDIWHLPFPVELHGTSQQDALAALDRLFKSDIDPARVAAIAEGEATLAFDATGAAFDAALAEVGAMPLPPYIAALRAPDAQDRTDYQTVWARAAGAVAAPTASLHFDAPLLAQLARDGVEFVHVTLHVGAGTFLPLRGEDPRAQRLHAEWGEVSPEAAALINEARPTGGRIVAIGTTALRLLETAALHGDSWQRPARPFRGLTDLFLLPGHRFRSADALMTNFHLPKSTLFMLVCAFAGTERMRAAYAHAVAEGYRFYSYGDASLLFPEVAPPA